MTAVEEDLTALEDRVTAAEEEGTALNERLTTLEGRVSALEQAGNGLAVYDANGNRVGRVIGITELQNRAFVVFHIGMHKFLLWVNEIQLSGEFETSTQNSIFFETPDCTGPPFAIAVSSFRLPRVVVASPGNTLYVTDSVTPPQPMTFRSFLPGAAGDAPGPCGQEAGPIVINSAVPAIPLLDLNTVFTPPFSVR
jgi:hypothetical protein